MANSLRTKLKKKKFLGKMFLLTKQESYPKQNRNKMIMILLMFYTWLKNFPNIKLIQTRNIFLKYFALIKIELYTISTLLRNTR